MLYALLLGEKRYPLLLGDSGVHDSAPGTGDISPPDRPLVCWEDGTHILWPHLNLLLPLRCLHVTWTAVCGLLASVPIFPSSLPPSCSQAASRTPCTPALGIPHAFRTNADSQLRTQGPGPAHSYFLFCLSHWKPSTPGTSLALARKALAPFSSRQPGRGPSRLVLVSSLEVSSDWVASLSALITLCCSRAWLTIRH